MPQQVHAMLPSQTTEIHPQDPHMVEGENPFLKVVLWPPYAVPHAHMYRYTIKKIKQRSEREREGMEKRRGEIGEGRGERRDPTCSSRAARDLVV